MDLHSNLSISWWYVQVGFHPSSLEGIPLSLQHMAIEQRVLQSFVPRGLKEVSSSLHPPVRIVAFLKWDISVLIV